MVGVNSFGLDADLQELLIDSGNWDFTPSWPTASDQLPQDSYVKVNNLVPTPIAALMRMILQTHNWLAVGLDGVANKPVEQIGNYRLSNYNEELAEVLWRRIKPILPLYRVMDAHTPTDHDNITRWRPVGVSPLFRYIRYAEGGQLVAHYDATYKDSATRRTLMSLVIYLTNNERGATRFLKDPQAGKRMDEMDFQDWDRAGNDDEVILRIKPAIGDAIIFDHRMLHDGEPLAAGDPEKIIIRTDIMFEAY